MPKRSNMGKAKRITTKSKAKRIKNLPKLSCVAVKLIEDDIKPSIPSKAQDRLNRYGIPLINPTVDEIDLEEVKDSEDICVLEGLTLNVERLTPDKDELYKHLVEITSTVVNGWTHELFPMVDTIDMLLKFVIDNHPKLHEDENRKLWDQQLSEYVHLIDLIQDCSLTTVYPNIIRDAVKYKVCKRI